MKDYISLITALIGIFLGGAIQYFFGRHAKKGEGLDKLQSDAYVDFVRGITGAAMAQRFSDPKTEATSVSLMVDAKVRIGIYGDPEVAHAVGVFFEKYGDMSKPEDMRSLVDLMQKMRASVVGQSDNADWIALSRILFSKDLTDVHAPHAGHRTTQHKMAHHRFM